MSRPTFVNIIRKIGNVWTFGYRYITWFPIDESFVCKDWTEPCKNDSVCL